MARPDVDSRVAASVAALYLVLCAVVLPLRAYPHALGVGLAVFVVVALIARTVGRGKIHGMSVFAVAVGSAVVLVVPAFAARHAAAVPLAVLGVQAAVLLWAAGRWNPRPPAKKRTPLRDVWGVALFAAAGLSAIATIPIAIGFLTDGWGAAPVLLVYPGYFAGTLTAATVYWLLQRVAHLAIGRYLIGVLGGFCVYGAMAPIVLLLKEEPIDLWLMLLLSGIPGSIVGPALALEFADD
ncbi:MAG TPA: hypothetical protein VF710_12270 [Longimicrobium sp.]|jgi:hypothetical protein